MSRRLFRPSASFVRAALGGVIAAAVVACGDISLSDSAGFAAAPAPAFNDLDGSIDAAGPSGRADSASPDASAPSALVGSSLCNYDYAIDASHNCRPDDSSQCPDATDAGAADGGDAGPPPSACHVVQQPGGHVTQACTVAGSGGDGDRCQTGADCQASYECVGSPGRCRHYCCSGDTSCDGSSSPSFCDVQPVATDVDASSAPTYRVPVCVPVSECKLLQSGQCPDGQTCAVVKDDGSTSCVAIGPANVGDSCDVDHCMKDLTCLGSGPTGRTCYRLCDTTVTPSTCPSMETCVSSAQIFKNPEYGICQ